MRFKCDARHVLKHLKVTQRTGMPWTPSGGQEESLTTQRSCVCVYASEGCVCDVCLQMAQMLACRYAFACVCGCVCLYV